MATYLGNYVAILHVAMTSKCTLLYKGILEKIRDKFPSLQPKEIMSDFERSLRNAVGAVFPEARVVGCAFHYAKAVLSKINKVGLKPYYHPGPHDHELSKMSNILRQLMGLPLLSATDMRFELPRIETELARTSVSPKIKTMLRSLFDYIFETWVSRFGCSSLSVYGAKYTTNNALERLHATMNESITEHGTIFHFLLDLNENIIKGNQHILTFRHNDLI